jgi:hypothetical protein
MQHISRVDPIHQHQPCKDLVLLVHFDFQMYGRNLGGLIPPSETEIVEVLGLVVISTPYKRLDVWFLCYQHISMHFGLQR